MLNGLVGFQLLDDGTAISMLLVLGSAAAVFVGTGYIALDTAFSWTGRFANSLQPPNYNVGLYVLYWLLPLICLVVFFLLETVLVLRVLGERKPMRQYHPMSLSLRTNENSLSDRRSASLCFGPNLSVHHQQIHLYGYEWQN